MKELRHQRIHIRWFHRMKLAASRPNPWCSQGWSGGWRKVKQFRGPLLSLLLATLSRGHGPQSQADLGSSSVKTWVTYLTSLDFNFLSFCFKASVFLYDQTFLLSTFFKKILIYFYLFIWLHRLLVAALGRPISAAACRIFSYTMGTLSCGMWDLVP